MALITKIREKSGVAVAFIAVSLILFIVGSDLLGGNSLFSGDNQTVGEIAGEKILYPDFSAKVQEATQNFQAQSQKAPNDQEQQQIRNQVWDRYINDIAFQKEFDELGITVSNEELVDMVQGNNIHPAIKQQFSNPQTGAFDKTQVIQFLKNLKTMQPAQQQSWLTFEKSLAVSRVREKYENMLSLSNNVTSLEAKNDYQAQNAKVDAKYLFVPFSSIVDSTIKVTDSQLEDYLSKHKDRYKGFESRSLEYVIFNVVPTKEDSAAFYEQIKDLARGLGAATNDSAYAASNSDIVSPSAWSLTELPESVKSSLPTFNVGGVYGPFKDAGNYSILKYKGIAKDSLSTIRASHIVFSFASKTDSAKAVARAKALAVLNQIKGGANFEAMAQQNGGDGSAQNGGDLGYFKNNGAMVKPFETAVFAFNGTGLLPNLVETDFGYHIIKVTEAKSNIKYRVSLISKVLSPSQQTRDVAYSKAELFASENNSIDKFKAAIKKDKLISLTADRVMEGSSSINGMQNAREITLWAFGETAEKGSISNAFEINDNYLVAAVTGTSSKDKPSIEDYKDELKFRVIADIKAGQIVEKLNSLSGSLEQIAQKYGAGAIVETSPGITLANGSLKSAGSDPVAIGKLFGLKPSQKSKAIKGESGVFIVEGTAIQNAPEIADYSQFKNQGIQNLKGRGSYYVSEAIKENAKIKDNKAKFY
ncbi:MAG: peptidylprolyl isomerase [Bacteroidota bacterium]